MTFSNMRDTDRERSVSEVPLCAKEYPPGSAAKLLEPLALQFGHFLVCIPSARRTNGKQPRTSALGRRPREESP